MFVSEMIFVNRTSPCLQFKRANFNLKLMPVCYYRWTGRISGTISVARRQIHVRLRHADMFMSFFMSQKIPKDLEVLLYKTNSFHFAVVSSVIDAQKTSERSISDNT